MNISRNSSIFVLILKFTIMAIQKYKTTGNRGLFDEQETYQNLSNIGNPLERISDILDFEMFRGLLESKLLNTNKKSNAGAKPFDVVVEVQNLSLKSISDFSVSYSLDFGNNFVNQQFNKTIEAGQKKEITFQKQESYLSGKYDFLIVGNLQNDMKTVDDTILRKITNPTIVEFPFEESFKICKQKIHPKLPMFLQIIRI